ncbi:MAG: hypothetical protein ACLQDY_26420 [Streptosporangiaceae bacterium]
MRITPLMCVFRLSQLCARRCYVASGGWWLVSLVVIGRALPRLAT